MEALGTEVCRHTRGLKVAALLGLGVFWFDKASDLILLLDIWGPTWTSKALLALFLFQYFVTGYISVVRFGVSRAGWKLGMQLFVCTVLPSALCACCIGMPATASFDVLLFLSDLGVPLAYIDARYDMGEYQLFRDVGRGLCGTLPTIALQAYAFTVGTTPSNNMELTSSVFITSFVASALQLLKVAAELMYVSYRRNENLFVVLWQVFSAKKVIKGPAFVGKTEQPLAGQVSSGQLNVI